MSENELVVEILAARDAGHTRCQAAKTLELSGSVFWRLIRQHQIDGWPESPKERAAKKREASKAHIDRICQLRDAGHGHRTIAKELGVTRWCVQDMIKRLGIPWPDQSGVRQPQPGGFVRRPKMRRLSRDEKTRYRELRTDFGLPSHEAFAQLEREKAKALTI